MTTDDTMDDENDAASRKGKGRGESGSPPPQKSLGTVSPAFFESMARLGIGMEQISRIFKDWSHLTGDELSKAMAVFARDLARASAHSHVDFKGDFTLIVDTLKHLDSASIRAMIPKLSAEDQQRFNPR